MANTKESLKSLLRIGLILLFGGIALTLYFYWDAVTYNKSMYLIVFGAPIFGLYFLYMYFDFKGKLRKGATVLPGLKVYPISNLRKTIETVSVIISIILTISMIILLKQLS